MRILIATVQVPFIRGGGEILAEQLLIQLIERGHSAELFTLPFRFFPISQVIRSIDIWEKEDLHELNGFEPDMVICLKFPSYYLKHNNKTLWLLHQHREVYDLYDRRNNTNDTLGLDELKRTITEKDSIYISSIKMRYTISQTVSSRLSRYNAIDSIPLYHPPLLADTFYCSPPQPFIFFPSRIEQLKRQELFIHAMKHVVSPVVGLIAGTGGQEKPMEQMINRLGMERKVRMLGRVSHSEKVAYYANSLGVFFGPLDEDYGYVTLEAMLASKPVITCRDSGGPLEFVENGVTGLVVDPEPEAVAEAIDYLWNNKKKAAIMGVNANERYRELHITWDRVIDALTTKQQ
jgi:glycosyltransferase involved in cell wall biosynthesis